MKKIVISTLISVIAPIILNAGGVGVYIPYSLGIDVERTNEYAGTDIKSKYNYTLDKKSGIGFAVGTNLAKDKVVGYKFAVEYTHPKATGWRETADKIEMLHTFEFAVINTDVVKLWVGPRVNIGYETFDNGIYDRRGTEIGIAQAVGININLKEHFTIAFDVDYKYAKQIGSWNQGIDSGTYREHQTGPTARLGFFYRFAE